MNKTAKYICTLLCFCIPAVAAAQITINSSDMPVKGDEVIFTKSSSQINVDTTGPGMVWDFSELEDLEQDTAKFINPKEINEFLGFAFSGCAGIKAPALTPLVDNMYGFYKSSSKAFVQAGTAISLPMTELPMMNIWSDPDEVYQFPLSYGDESSGDFEGSITVQGFTYSTKGSRTTVVDGWGTVITPYKSFSCIRVKSVVKQTDQYGIVPINTDRVEYRWLAKGSKIPVLEVIVPEAGSLAPAVVRYADKYRHIVNPQGPKVNFTVSDSNVYMFEEVQLINQSQGALTNLWYIAPETFAYVNNSSASSNNPSVVFTAPGTYTIGLRSTNLQGNNYLTKYNYINVTVPPAPVAAFRADMRKVQTKERVQLMDMSTNVPMQWHWSFTPDNVEYLEGTGEYSQHPVVMFKHPGRFTVQLQVMNAGGTDQLIKTNFIEVNGVSSIEAQGQEVSASLYPNPAVDVLNISVPQSGKYTVSIVDMAGKIRQEQVVIFNGSTPSQINVSALPAGLYIMKASGSEQLFTLRFVKQ